MWQDTLRQLKQLSRKQNGVFTTADVRDAGISTRTFYRMRDAGGVICISRGVYQMAETDGAQHAGSQFRLDCGNANQSHKAGGENW